MNIVIRKSVLSDLAALTDIYNHYVHETSITFDIQPFTVDQRREWFQHYGDSGRYRLLVAESSGQLVGYASSSMFRKKAAYETSVETSIYLHPAATGKGIGAQLYGRLFSTLAQEDVHRAYAGVTLPNPPSIAFHQHFGFASIGIYREVGRKFGSFWDVQWFEKCL